MTFSTLINAEELTQHLDDPDWVIVDCRFYLDDTELGRRTYQHTHIPGAIYAHLDQHLSGPIIPGQTSRHPFPAVEPLTQTLSGFGIDARAQVIVYDDRGGGIAGRLWSMLRWLGHENVALLNGGIPHWQQLGYPTSSGTETRPRRDFVPQINADFIVSTDDIMAMRNNISLLLDSRTQERYDGEKDELDPVAGHIPGAVSAHYEAVLNENGLFRSPAELSAYYQALLQDTPADQVVFYCGSGVTANLNILAMLHAGFGAARLYPGSWSEWITDPTRPVEIP